MRNLRRRRGLEGPFRISDAANNIFLTKFLIFLKRLSESLKNGLQPQFIRNDANVDVDIPNQSLALSVNEP